MQLSLMVLPHRHTRELVALARLAEDFGYDAVWVPDERFFREVYSVCALLAQATDRIAIGTGVTDPFSRHPALTATAIATLDEISEGRAILGMGAGISGFRELGIDRRGAPEAVRGAVELIRGLLDGREMAVDDERLSFHGALSFEPLRASLPIYVAGNKPKMLGVAGAVADGAIVQACVSEVEFSALREHILRGLEHASRQRSDLEIVLRVDVAVGETRESAYDALRHRIARIVIQDAPGFERLRGLGLEPSSELVAATAGAQYTNDSETLQRIGAHVPDEFVDAFAIASTPDALPEVLTRLADMGADHVLMNPIPVRGDIETAIRAASGR
jgi:5,10-methylenetetrahydromethanopterin reductase